MAQSDFTIDVGGVTTDGARGSRGASDPGLRDKAQRRAGRSDISRSLGRISKSRLVRRASAFAATRANAAIASLGARAVALTSVGTVGGALAVGIGVGAKFATGRSFDGLSEALADRLFGDADEYARAQRVTRERILGNETLLRSVAALGTDQAKPIYDALFQQELDRQLARSAVMNDPRFDVKDELDIVVEGMAKGVEKAWNEVGDEVTAMLRGMKQHFFDRTPTGVALKAIKAIFGGSR